MLDREIGSKAPLLVLSGIRGRDPKTGTLSNDIHEQAAQAFENIARQLKERGLTLRHVVKVTMFMESLDYRDPIHEVWMRYFPVDPPARTSFQVLDTNERVGENAHFVLEVVALADPASIEGRETVDGPPGAPKHMAGMVTAVKAGGFIFFSAIRGRNRATRKFSDDTGEQMQEALKVVRMILEDRGLPLERVVKVTAYVNDLAYHEPIQAVLDRDFTGQRPTLTVVPVVNASASPRGNPQFVLDVTALAD